MNRCVCACTPGWINSRGEEHSELGPDAEVQAFAAAEIENNFMKLMSTTLPAERNEV
jgi:hypothetical protein